MRTKQFSQLLIFVFSCLSLTAYGFRQDDSASYVSQFNQLIANSYAAVDDPAEGPSGLLSACANQGNQSATGTVTVSEASPTVLGAADVQQRCGETNLCVIGNNVTVNIDTSLKLHSLVVKDGGTVRWNDETQIDAETWLCAGYAVVESGGTWDMNLQDPSKRAWIYIMNNGATHMMLRTRAFGSSYMGAGTEPHFSVIGRELERTWSLLAEALTPNSTTIRVMHDPIAMGWQAGDRIAVAPTDRGMDGDAQDFFISTMQTNGAITLNTNSNGSTHIARHIKAGTVAALKAAEVINLSRNIVVTGDDFEEVACSNSFAEEFNFGTSTQGCRCDGNRNSCTVGLTTASAHGGFSEIANVRVEKCGQRGIEGKYCLHFHHMMDCADDSNPRGSSCISRNNAVEFSQQRAQIVHSTHNAVVDSNVYYDVRGANLYIEDGNEMLNKLTYNVGICPRGDNGCTLPGTSNGQGDTSLNQSGIYMESPNNLMIGNRMVNFFNGMFNQAGGGRGPVGGQVCGGNVPLGHWEGNTFSGNGRFGTYLLNGNYPLQNTGQSLIDNGTTNGDNDCASYDASGNDLGLSSTILSHFDYGNGFVGQYGAGDLQYRNHVSIDSLWAMYWKESKTMQDGCSAHISDAYYEGRGAMELPDTMGAFIIENTTITDLQLNANHHCAVDGGTGILCGAHYVLHDVEWRDPKNSYIKFNLNNNTNSGGIFSLSPENIAEKANGATFPFFPTQYNSVVGSPYTYLLDLPDANCVTSGSLGVSGRYDNGILCEAWLTRLNIFARNPSGDLRVRVYDNQSGALLAEQTVPLRGPGDQRGYTIPVVPGDLYRYELEMANGGNIGSDWIIDFGDLTVSNRWGVEHLHLNVQGRDCSGTIYSNHDRRFYASEEAWDQGWGRGACTSHPPMPAQDCSVIPDLTLNSDTAYDELKIGQNSACNTIDCGENGACSARYLGGDLPVIPSYQCACAPGWYGSNCQTQDPNANPTPLPTIDPTTLPTPRPTPTADPSNPTPTPIPTDPGTPANGSVTGLMLVNANSDSDIQSLTNGDYILQSNVGTALSIVAMTTGTVGSLDFEYGASLELGHTETGAPYALGGDGAGNYNAVTYLESLGQKRIRATAYSGAGAVIGSIELTFEIVTVLPTPTPTPTETTVPGTGDPTPTPTPGTGDPTPTPTTGGAGNPTPTPTNGPSGNTNTPQAGASSSGGGGSVSWTGLMLLLLLGAQWMRRRKLSRSWKF